MRAGATLLIALLLGSTVAVAQDEPPPSPNLVNPVCDYFFAEASEPDVGTPADSAVSADASPEALADSMPPGLAADAGPAPLRTLALLDHAIRSCSDLEDFIGASARHPRALGDIDPMDFLVARCRDELTDLARHATCASLEQALATPAPTAAPDPTPSPTPARTSEDDGRDADPTPKPRLVRLPRIEESVRGATKIRYFSVTGRSPDQLLLGTLEGARRHCPSHGAAACVRLRPRLQPRFQLDAMTRACRIVDARVSTKAVVFLPRWTKPRMVPPELLAWWRKVSRHFAWHERQHIKIQNRYNAVLRKQLKGKPCSAAQRVVTRWSRESQRAQEAFDRRDQRWQVPAYRGPWQ